MPITHQDDTSIVITPKEKSMPSFPQIVKVEFSSKKKFPELTFHVYTAKGNNQAFFTYLQSLGILAKESYIRTVNIYSYGNYVSYIITEDVGDSILQLRQHFEEDEFTALTAKSKQLIKKPDEKRVIAGVAFYEKLRICAINLVEIETFISKARDAIEASQRFDLPSDEQMGFGACHILLRGLDETQEVASLKHRARLFKLHHQFQLLKAEFNAIENFLHLQLPKKQFSQQPIARHITSAISSSTNNHSENLDYWVIKPLERAKEQFFRNYEAFKARCEKYPASIEKHFNEIKANASKDGTLSLSKGQFEHLEKEIYNFKHFCAIITNIKTLEGRVDIGYLWKHILPAVKNERLSSLSSISTAGETQKISPTFSFNLYPEVPSSEPTTTTEVPREWQLRSAL